MFAQTFILLDVSVKVSFWMRLTFKWVDWVKRIALLSVSGPNLLLEGLDSTKTDFSWARRNSASGLSALGLELQLCPASSVCLPALQISLCQASATARANSLNQPPFSLSTYRYRCKFHIYVYISLSVLFLCRTPTNTGEDIRYS